MGKNEDQNLQQREKSFESGNSQGHQGFLCGRCWMVLSRLSNEFSFRCVFVLFLSLSVLLPGIFWILPFRSIKSGFDAKQAIKLSAPVHAYFTLQKPVSELVQHIEKLEYDICEEISVPDTKVAILSMHQSGASNSTDVVFGVLTALIGSANINDRSLLGSRDSEIGVLIEDKELVDSRMGGNPWKAGKFALSLRLSLWSEHLGLRKGEINQIIDPISDSSYKDIWVATAMFIGATMGSSGLQIQTENGQIGMPSSVCCVVVEYLPGG